MGLKLLSSMATRELLGELVSAYRHATNQPVNSEAAGGVEVAKRVLAGEAVDVVILASNAIDKLIAQGMLLAGSRVDLARSGIAIAVRAGVSKPDIGSEAGVREAVLAAKTLSFSTGPSGVYLENLFRSWGILEQIRSRIAVPPPGVPVGSLVAVGTAELGFQQSSELMTIPGIQVVGPLPSEIQSMTVFSGGISESCAAAAAARALLDYLASPATTAVKRRYGMDAPC